MTKVSNFKELKENSTKYNDWKNKKDNDMQRKIAYLKANPINKDEFEKQVKRAKIVIDAVDTMDTYSQKKAESTEFATDMMSIGVGEGGTYASLGIGAIALLATKGGKEAFKEVLVGNFKNFRKLIPASIAFVIPLALISTLFSFWSSKKQIESSRYGRIQAMEKDLSSINQFALMNDEQQKQIEQISKNIVIPKDDTKNLNNSESLELKESLKNIIKPDKELQAKCQEISNKIESDSQKLENLNLTQAEIIDAKKDKELIHTIVEKIDISSQDYAEKAELTTSIISNIAFGSGGIIGLITNNILSKTKFASKAGAIGVIAYLLTSILGSAFSTKIQLEASKVGRFKAKEDLLNNPEEILYVSEDKYQNINISTKKEEKQGFFKALKGLIEDNKRYNQYIKENSEKNAQLKKAKEEIKITDKQASEAKRLQNNVFNMFNRLDEKSQSYSETTEAIGESVNNFVSNLFSALTTIFAGSAFLSKNSKNKSINFILMTASMIPTLIINIITTKAQKKASRVASMVAIEETSDYRHFASKNDSQKNQDIDKLSNINKKFISKQTT